MRKKILSLCISALFISGCQSSFGPSVLDNTHIAYNQAIVNTLNQQMLLNLVRLKYRDETHFLKIGSVTASLRFESAVGIGTQFDLGPGGNLIAPELGFAYSDSPTISYQPLQGEDFLKSILSAVSIDTMLVLSATGWNIERVFALCVEEINDTHNAPKASGPTPSIAPKFKDFNRLLSLLQSLQNDRGLEIGLSHKNADSLLMRFSNKAEHQHTVKELMTLFGLPVTTRLVNISSIEFLDLDKPRNNNQLTIYTRSISSILFYLSHNIQIPQQHIDAGLVTVTKYENGNTFDWSQTPTGKIFKVKSSEDYPEKAFLAIPYRNHWYYIADNDLQSKSTFMLLMQLFDYQAGRTKFEGPQLTLPIR